MGNFINAIGSGSNVTTGERRFGERLRTLLEDDYLCWHDVPIGPRRQHPDFVVLHPGHGIWIFEVKDWRLDSLRMIGNHEVELFTAEGAIKTVPSPLAQARSYANAVVNKLSTDPQLQDPSHRYRGRICFPYAYAAVLTNITRSQLDEVLTEADQEAVLPPRLVICKDEMLESTPADVFQEKMWGMFQYRFGQPLSLPQIERVRWHLFPEIRITSVQRDFFPEASTEDEPIPDIIKVMDLQQEQLARNLGSGHRVVHGVAGSGKTLILGYRCMHLARQLHKPVLVLCFNITLAARLRAFVESNGIDDRVRVHHFHEWCKTQLETYHVEPSGDGEHWERQVQGVIEGVERGFIPRAQYGAVLLDEGHDFEPEWLRLVTQMVDPATDSLLLLYDGTQSIYKNRGTSRFSLSSVGIKAQGRTTILRLNYRNTREILAFAYDFASAFLTPEDADDDHIPLIRPEAAGLSGPAPAYRHWHSLDDEVAFAVDCARKWHAHGTPLSEIAILACSHPHGTLAAEELAKAGIPALWMDHRDRKKAYDPRKNCIAILPIPSSKGLEFHSVIVLGTGHMDAKHRTEADNARLLYVAMTRAKEHLLVTASARTPLTARLEKLAA
ncbi:MAG: nuclease-related domain-containing DEAD/DEAH box helicase [Terrimicrobiaceae bacterium]